MIVPFFRNAGDDEWNMKLLRFHVVRIQAMMNEEWEAVMSSMTYV